jgi:hypothetical protein
MSKLRVPDTESWQSEAVCSHRTPCASCGLRVLRTNRKELSIKRPTPRLPGSSTSTTRWNAIGAGRTTLLTNSYSYHCASQLSTNRLILAGRSNFPILVSRSFTRPPRTVSLPGSPPDLSKVNVQAQILVADILTLPMLLQTSWNSYLRPLNRLLLV